MSSEASDDNLKALRRKASDLNRSGLWGPKALEVNTLLTQLEPTDVAAHTRRAKCLRQAGNLGAAEQSYLRALELSPEKESIQEAVDAVRREAQQRAVQERERERDQARRQALLDTLDTPDEAVKLARGFRSEKPPDVPNAREAYRRGLRLAPERTDIEVEAAGMLRACAETAQALVVYDHVLSRAPGYSPAMVGKAGALLDLFRVEEALELCLTILRSAPNDAYANRVKARAHAMLGEQDEALWSWEQAED